MKKKGLSDIAVGYIVVLLIVLLLVAIFLPYMIKFRLVNGEIADIRITEYIFPNNHRVGREITLSEKDKSQIIENLKNTKVYKAKENKIGLMQDKFLYEVVVVYKGETKDFLIIEFSNYSSTIYLSASTNNLRGSYKFKLLNSQELNNKFLNDIFSGVIELK